MCTKNQHKVELIIMQHIININSSSRSRDSIKFFNKKSALQQWSHFTRHFIIIFASLVSLVFHIAAIIERLLLIMFDIFSSCRCSPWLWPLITDSVLFTTLLWRREGKERSERSKKWWKRYSPNSNEVTNCWPLKASSMRKMCMR